MATCKTCEAPIVWAIWETTGKPHPVDAKSVATGDLVIVNGKVRKATAQDTKLHRDRYTSHWDTCPDREEWRSGKAKQLALLDE